MQEGLIATQGAGFDNNDIYGINAAGNNIANAFADALGAGYSPEDAWNTVFGNTTVTFVETGYDCHGIGVNMFLTKDYHGCWAVASEYGTVYISTEYINASPSSGEIVEWASHEIGHEVDRLMSNYYGYINDNFYGANQISQYPGGLVAVDSFIPDQYQQSLPQDRGLNYEIFADAFTCWSHPNCEFTDQNFSEYFNNLMTQFAIDRSR
jgi:hypothetical protein